MRASNLLLLAGTVVAFTPWWHHSVNHPAVEINCRGNMDCYWTYKSGSENANLTDMHNILNQMIVTGQGDLFYPNGRWLFCATVNQMLETFPMFYCGFFQNVKKGGGTVNEAWEAIRQMRMNGCELCGSAPMERDNPGSIAQFTINRVHCKYECCRDNKFCKLTPEQLGFGTDDIAAGWSSYGGEALRMGDDDWKRPWDAGPYRSRKGSNTTRSKESRE